MLDSKHGRVMTLISQTKGPDTKFIVNHATIDHIAQHSGQYCFISICGDYRSGKSFLLNSLFFNYNGFETSATTESCTKGMTIWSQPLVQGNLNIWIVDTEGFGSMQQDSTYDGKIFLMNLLLSNIILYNSFGAIDENSINKLAMICRQAKSMDSSLGHTTLFWILRDFSLEMINREGKQLTSHQYMEECLKENEHNHNKTEKEFLKNLFRDRYCVPLIRPVIDEEKLGNLKTVNKTYLRPEFKQQIEDLYSLMEQAVSCKQINGVKITHQNISIFINEFVKAVNSEVLDCNLACTYERILDFQLSLEKETITVALKQRISGMSKLLPVQQDHLQYLRKEIQEMLAQKMTDIHHSNPKDKQLLALQIANQINEHLQQLEQSNREQLQQEIRDYLYRHLIELYPKFITLTLHNFEPRLQELLTKFKEDYRSKYRQYFANERNLDQHYCEFMEKEQKKAIFEIAKRWKAAQKEGEEKGEELKKNRKIWEEQSRKLKEEKIKLIKALEDSKRQESRSILKLREDAEESFRQEAGAIARNYELHIRQLTNTHQQRMEEMRSKLASLQQQNNSLSNQLQLEKQSLLQKLALEKEKAEITTLKLEQCKNNFDMQQEQLKNSYENRIRIIQMKCNELQNYLSNERKKYSILADQRKLEQCELLEDIADKNQKILDLNEQLVRLQEKYKVELERILLEQKEILCKTINLKISETEHKCKLYEGKLQQYALAAEEKQHFERKSEELEIEVRELHATIDELRDHLELINSRNKKCENELEEKERALQVIRINYEKEISLVNQTLANNKKFIAEAEDRHREEVEHLKNKIELELKEQSTNLNQRTDDIIKQNRVILEQKFDKQRSQLKDIIKNNYDQIENLKIQRMTLTNQLQRMHSILSRIKNKNEHLGQPAQRDSTHRSEESESNDYNLIEITESPEEQCENIQTGGRKEQLDQVEFLGEQIEQIYDSMRREVTMMSQERQQIKHELKTNIEELESYEAIISKVKSENKFYKAECEDLKLKLQQLHPLSKELHELKDKLQATEKELTQTRREMDLKEQLSNKRDEALRENLQLYKQTIANLTDQNKQLNYHLNDLIAKNQNVQTELERFRIWAVEVKTKPAVDVPTSCHNFEESDNSVHKIQQLEGQIKRLAKKLQEQKISKIEKSPIKQNNLLSDVVLEQRIHEIEALRIENQRLYKKLEETHQQQLRKIEQNKSNKTKQGQIEDIRLVSLRDELETVKRRSRDTVSQLQAQLATHIEEKEQLKKQFADLENNLLRKYELNEKMMQQEITALKKEKTNSSESFSRKMAALQETLSNRSHEADRRVSQAELKFEQFQAELEKEQNRVVLQGERHRLKYEHLLKVNGELIKEIESLKSKAHQITLKEKYKSKISNLFND